MSHAGPPIHYIAIGASAGGLEAIEAFFKEMPVDTGLAFIVIQHLSPDYKSLMPELLANRTEIPVFRAENNIEVEANRIYLITPRKNLTIFHGKLLLKEQERTGGFNLPIDIFFKSLAEDQGEKAIGVILSGTGSDGTRGARAIKEVGGMVMAQSEESAKFDGMPRSVIATGLADFILAPEEMAAQLRAYSKHPYATKPKRGSVLLSNDDGLTRIFSLLRERSRVDFTFYKPSTVVRRIERRMMVNQIQELPDYVHYLDAHPAEVDVLRQDLLIGVTSFLRDPQAFESLESKYIPELLGRENLRELRVWVAACSTGEEAYSLAILFREIMERMGRLVDVKIFATDVDHAAIERASAGVFPVGIVTDLPSNLLAKYFIQREDRFQISRSIREMVVFAQHNLVKDPPFTNIDLISCRNVLIYLQPVLQRKVLELFNFSLNSHGVLFLGTSETVGEMGDFFDPLDPKWKIYRSRGKRRPVNLGMETAAFNHTQMQRGRSPGLPSTGAVMQDERILERFLQALAGDYVDVAMLINAELELIHAVGETARYLRVAPGLMTADISKLMPRELSIPLSNGAQKVIKSGMGVVFSNIRLQLDGRPESLQMRIRPVPQRRGQDPLVAIFIELMEREVGPPAGAESHSFDVSAESQQRIADLESELQFTRENLQATVEELETSNEELQATNEELLASNEELQSTNEELQSVNEELYTVNAEYQSKITELTDLNNDLDNLLDSTEIATLFLDENLDIRRFSPRIARLFKIIDGDLGRSILDINNSLKGVDLKALITRVLGDNRSLEQEVYSDDGWYLMRILPYRITSDLFAGVVVLFVNIHQTKQAQLALAKNQERAALALRAAAMGIWEWDIPTGTLHWSDAVYPMFGQRAGEFTPSYARFLEQVHPDDRGAVTDAIVRALDTGGIYRVDHRVVLPSGAIRWLQEHGEVFHNAEGDPTHMIGAVQDITERKLGEADLHEARQTLQQVLNTIPMRIFWKDREGRYLGCNRLFAADAGFVSPEKLRGKTDAELSWAAQAPLYRQDDREVMESGRAKLLYEERQTNAQGEDVWVETSKAPLLRLDGSVYGVLGTYSDITERKRAATELESSRALLGNLLEAIPLPIFYKDMDGIYLDCNTALVDFIGRERSAILGRRVEEVWPPEVAEVYRRTDARLFSGEDQGVQIYRSVMPHADGTLHPVEFRKARFVGPDGTPGGVVAVMLDLAGVPECPEVPPDE